MYCMFLGASFYIPSKCLQMPHFVTSSLHSGPSQECCYDSAGNLHTNSPGGGSVDRFGSSTMDSRSDHILFDLFPYIHCCKGDLRSCTSYYEVRPSDLGRNFFPPIPGAYLWHRIRCRWMRIICVCMYFECVYAFTDAHAYIILIRHLYMPRMDTYYTCTQLCIHVLLMSRYCRLWQAACIVSECYQTWISIHLSNCCHCIASVRNMHGRLCNMLVIH